MRRTQNVCKITTLDLLYVAMVQSMVEILQNFVAFSEYKNLKNFFAHGKMKKLPSKVAHNRQLAQSQLKSQILFHENCFSRYLCLMTLDTGDGR